mgnify:FL=1
METFYCNNANKIFFTSDTHFSHKNILKYQASTRPFETVEEMNDKIVENWNSVVPKDGIVYHLGDFSTGNSRNWAGIRKRLNGRIGLILGNHDLLPISEIQPLFMSINDVLELKIQDPDAYRGCQGIILNHYAMRVWNKSHYGSWSLYGHSHGSLFDDPNLLSIDVGVDSFNLSPVSYYQIKEIMAKKTFQPVDHHVGSKQW